MNARYRLQARPAPVATLPPRGGPQCVRFSMARSVRFSVAVDRATQIRWTGVHALFVQAVRHPGRRNRVAQSCGAYTASPS